MTIEKQYYFKLILLLLTILFSGNVYAVEDFSASASKIVELCPCSNQDYKVTVSNTGSETSTFSVISSESLREWLTFIPDTFTLGAGQAGAFLVRVNSACNIKDNFESEIYIVSDTGVAKSIKQQLQFSDCYKYELQEGKISDSNNTDFEAHEGAYSICTDEQLSIPILIENEENFANRYKIALDAPKWVTFGLNSATLGPQSSGLILINLNTNDVEGEFKLKLNTISDLGKVKRAKSLDLDVRQCYGINVNIEKNDDLICGNEKHSYDIFVKNKGTLGRNVKITKIGPEWASIENNTFFLGGNKEKLLQIKAEPGKDVSGNFELEAIFDQMNNSIKSSESIRIQVVPEDKCMEPQLESKSRITNYYEPDFIQVKIKNIGVREGRYKIKSEGLDWVSVVPNSLRLKPNKQGVINLKIHPNPEIEEGRYISRLVIEVNEVSYFKDIEIDLKKENEVISNVKWGIKFFRYYIYVGIVLGFLLIIFKNPLGKTLKSAKKRFEKNKENAERKKTSRTAKIEKKKAEKREKKIGPKITENRKRRQIVNWIIGLVILTLFLIAMGHKYKLFNARYLHVYAYNIIVSYLYHILIGLGTVAVIFFAIILFNKFSNKKKSKKKEKKVSKPNKKKNNRNRSKAFTWFIIVIVGVLILASNNNLAGDLARKVFDFLIVYQYYFITGIFLLVVLILLLNFYKPISKNIKE
jgi:hypothetical protein